MLRERIPKLSAKKYQSKRLIFTQKNKFHPKLLFDQEKEGKTRDHWSKGGASEIPDGQTNIRL
jgi:hypothetical protein